MARGVGVMSLRRVAAQTLLATAASTLALGLAARRRGLGPLQPVNATSHWLNGEAVAERRRLDWRTTGVGFATHLAATSFWAALYESWRARGPASSRSVLGKAAAVSGVAALVDYTLTPRRFTPGWEFVLPARDMALAYAALALGLAAGGTDAA